MEKNPHMDMNVGLVAIVVNGQETLNITKKVVKEKNDETEYIYSNYNNYIVNIYSLSYNCFGGINANNNNYISKGTKQSIYS